MRRETRTPAVGFKRRLAMALAVASLASMAVAASSQAADEHRVDANLSLTGSTATSALDPVPDPGPSHPAKAFNDPCGVTTDAYGDIYVANSALSFEEEVGGETRFPNGRIDVFAPNGKFLTEVVDEFRPCAIAVDSAGRLYVHENWTSRVMRFNPSTYEPATGGISYESAPVPLEGTGRLSPDAEGLAVDRLNDHLYLIRDGADRAWVEDWTAEQTATVKGENRFGEGEIPNAVGIDVRAQNGDVYVAGSASEEPLSPRAYVIDGTSRHVKLTLNGSQTPAKSFSFQFGHSGVAVDQSNGDLYIGDLFTHHVVDQFDSSGNYIGQLALGVNGLKEADPFSAIVVDQGEHSPNQGYVFVTSGSQESNSHLYAFAPAERTPPEVRNAHAEGVGQTDALLAAEVNPNGFATSYRAEYGPADCATGPCQSAPVPAADAGSGGVFKPVSVPVTGLAPASTYHFRLVATSHCNPAEPEEECTAASADATFATYPAAPAQQCPNAGLRVGPSARLPDCRAYELVTPPDTNGRVPTATLFGEGRPAPPILLAAASGESVLFGTEGGALPGIGGGGFNDAYVSTRSEGGWHTGFAGLSGEEAQEPFAAGASEDHGYSFWDVNGSKGSLAGKENSGARTNNYLRGPGGSIEPVGLGSEGVDLTADGKWISPAAGHVIFSAKEVQLESDSPPVGTAAIYDRTPGGPTQVVSLLPGDVPQGAGEAAEYQGASEDGTAVAFKIGGKLYVHLTGADTREVAPAPNTYAGLSSQGRYLFYLSAGNVFRYDTSTGTATAVGSGGESTVVNVSADGTRAYFVSPVVLSAKPNREGASAAPGAENLYVWDGGSEAVRFLAAVSETDVLGEPAPAGGAGGLIGGLGMWVSDAVAPQQGQFKGPANDPSRTTLDGGVLVFESRAKLSGYDSEGHSEVYRYDYEEDSLACVSCSPIGAPATSQARLESRYAPRLFSIPPVNAISVIDNIAAGGNRVFFESGDALSFDDVDETNDVYEWEANGLGSCALPAGCIQLISSGHSAGPNFLYGVGGDGRDVFFWSGDELTGQDSSSAPSIYDARVNGGIATASAAQPCQDDACQGQFGPRPSLVIPATSAVGGERQVHPRHKHRHKRKRKHRHGRGTHHKAHRGSRGPGR